MKINVGMISLGCNKNRIDGEMMLAKLKEAGMQIVGRIEDADVMVVNTCGFIASAKEEAIETILECAQYKKQGLKGLVVTGCLSGRYGKDLAQEMPEVDAFLGVTAWDDIVSAVQQAAVGERQLKIASPQIAGDYAARILTTPGHYAYLKIAEGCNNCCTYCAIPFIRGKYQSRSMEDILKEANALFHAGVQELIVVAQDTTRYGIDLYGTKKLPDLLSRLGEIGFPWVRVLYCYPEAITDALLNTMEEMPNLLCYLDIPMQHFDDGVLKAMHRRNTRAQAYDLIHRIRERNAPFVLRTTLITGFPGETEEAFSILKQGVQDLQFDRLGVFAYSQEEGTLAATLPHQISEEIKQMRAEEIMQMQQGISLAKNKKRIGTKEIAVIDGETDRFYQGRTWQESPEIDGVLWIEKTKPLELGKRYAVSIQNADAYDLYGKVEP